MAKTFETPKGTRDFLPEEMRVRNAVFERLRRAFRLFGFDELDTPAFEYLEVLTLKAGPAAERPFLSYAGWPAPSCRRPRARLRDGAGRR